MQQFFPLDFRMELSYHNVMSRVSMEDIMELVYCNKCGKKIRMKNDIPQEDYVKVCKPWGYFSKKDGRTQEFVLCENCVEWLEREFVRPSTIYDTIELLS